MNTKKHNSGGHEYKSPCSLESQEYLNSVFANGFMPIITKPTRLSRTSATLIDHIYTNKIEDDVTTGVVVTDLSDHYGTLYIPTGSKTNPDARSAQKRFFNEENRARFIHELSVVDFSCVSDTECANHAYDTFLRLFKTAFNRAFPLKTIKVRTKYIKRDPWITRGMVTSSRKKLSYIGI